MPTFEPAPDDAEVGSPSSELASYRDETKQAASKMLRQARNHRLQGRDEAHDQLMLGIDVQHVPSHIVRELRDTIPIGSSFALAMATTNAFVRAAKNTSVRRYLRITQKEHGKKLAADLGLKIAVRYQEGVPLADVAEIPDSVVKPARSSGARGVLINSKRDGLTLVRDGTKFDSFADYRRIMGKRIKSGRHQDDWIVEEYLTDPDGEPARDFKFYTFYGTVGVTLECKRHPHAQYCFYEGTEQVDTGKYEDKSFTGSYLDPAWIKQMEQVSARIPLPFLRIDTYRTGKGLYFGEFTTVPGKYHQFNLTYDRKLGELWNQARADIFADLLTGKSFPEFARFVGVSSAAEESWSEGP